MEGMELDTTPPPHVACTDEQRLQLDAIRRGFTRIEAQMAGIGGAFDELIGVISALACHVSNLRRLRATERAGGAPPCADLVTQAHQVELIFGKVSTQVRRMEAIWSGLENMARSGLGFGGGCGGGDDAVDALAAGLERIRIDLCPSL